MTPQLKRPRVGVAGGAGVFDDDEDDDEHEDGTRTRMGADADEDEDEDGCLPSSSMLHTPVPPGAGEAAVPAALTPLAGAGVGVLGGTPLRTPSALRRSPAPAPSSTRVLRSSRALSLLTTLEAQVAGLKGRLLASAAENDALGARAARAAQLEAELAAERQRADTLERELAGVQREHDVLARRVLVLEAGYVCKCQGDVAGMKLDLARILAESAKERWSARSERRAAELTGAGTAAESE